MNPVRLEGVLFIYYAFISEGNDIKTKENMLTVQGFHKDGRFINFAAPFVETAGKIQFKETQQSTDIKTASGIFSHMFLHLDAEKRFLLPTAFAKKFGIDLNYQFVTIKMKNGETFKKVGIHGGEVSSAQVGEDFKIEDVKSVEPITVVAVRKEQDLK